MDYINKIFKTVSIKDNRRIIELYFQELYCCAPLSNKTLSQKLLLPVPIVTAIKNEGIKLGIFEQCGRGVGLTHNGKDYVEQALGFKGIDLCLYRRLAESAQARDAYADALSKKIPCGIRRTPRSGCSTGPSPMYRTDGIPQGFALLGKRHIDWQTNRMHGR